MKALIFGVTGQDGSYLAEILKARGYEVHGVKRRASFDNMQRLRNREPDFLYNCDLSDSVRIQQLIRDIQPDEIYNEADQDHAGDSFNQPYHASMVTGAAVGVILEAIKGTKIKFFQPLTSNMFGEAEGMMNENSPLNPVSPYACAKAYVYHLCKMYRKMGVNVYTAIFFNHTSSRQTDEYILPKLIKASKMTGPIQIGNIEAKIDIGHAREFMEAACNIMQGKPDDFVIGTGEAISIRQMAEWLGITDRLVVNPRFFRPLSTGVITADYSKATKAFGYEPVFKGQKLIEEMK